MARKGTAQIIKKKSKYKTPSVSSGYERDDSRTSHDANGDTDDDIPYVIPKNPPNRRKKKGGKHAEERENIDPTDGGTVAAAMLKLSSDNLQPRPDLYSVSFQQQRVPGPPLADLLFPEDAPKHVSPAVIRTVASPEIVVSEEDEVVPDIREESRTRTKPVSQQERAKSPSPHTAAAALLQPPAPAAPTTSPKRKRKQKKKKAGGQTAANAAPRRDSGVPLQDLPPASAINLTNPNNEVSMSGQQLPPEGGSIPSNQQRFMRACMVCSIVRTQQLFYKYGCPNCESFLELAGSSDQINDCTSQVFEGLISVADTNRSWVAKYQRIEGYVPGVYATQVEGILPEDVLIAVENAGIAYVPRDGSEQEMLGKD